MPSTETCILLNKASVPGLTNLELLIICSYRCLFKNLIKYDFFRVASADFRCEAYVNYLLKGPLANHTNLIYD